MLRSPSQDVDNPRDIICKLHKYILKDRIMQKMREKPYIDFDGGTHFLLSGYIQAYPHAVQSPSSPAGSCPKGRPALSLGLPLLTLGDQRGKQVMLRNKDDLLRFLSTIGLDPVDFPDWRGSLDYPTISLPQPWLPAKSRSRQREWQLHPSDSPQGPTPPRD